MAEIRVEDLSVTFPTEEGHFQALKGVSLSISKGERLAIIGESGCGKSVLGHSIMRLLDNISETTGRVFFGDTDIRGLGEKELIALRGERIALLPQSPSTSFNPVLRIGSQIDEVPVQRGRNKAEVRAETMSSLRSVGFSDPEGIYRTYPHRLSGGMCERALLVMSTVFDPEVIIADEPTKGLDPKNKIEVLRNLYRKTEGRILIMITHDYNAARMCERLVVMYAGRILEDGPSEEVLRNPRHPYTEALWASLPDHGMTPIPSPREGVECGTCDFASRCEHYRQGCDGTSMVEVGDRHYVRCNRA